MTPEIFDKVVDYRCRKIKSTLVTKAKEYSHLGDRLYNFKRASEMSGVTPIEALYGMMMKHMVSVQDLVDRHTIATEASLNEKIGDNINYLILLEALFIEDLPETMLRLTKEKLNE